ncbi:MAG: hypothetical protein QOH86_468 [Sphingomonadales bacterium]|jgi:hypothetical protein|nr:hypothetical protein [Sphingomonadales bacterium]
MTATSLIAAALAAATPGASCADAIRYDLDRSAFRTDGANRPIPAARLEPFRQKAAKAFRDAADGLCARKAIPGAKVAQIRRVVIQSAAGATETQLYEAREFGPHSLVFQWVFAEGALDVPTRRDIEEALVCRYHPEHKGCDEPSD